MSNKPKRNFPEDPFDDPFEPANKRRTLGLVEIAIAVAALAIGAYYLIQIADEETQPSVTPVVVEVTAAPDTPQDFFSLAQGLYDLDNYERAEQAYTQGITMAQEEGWELEEYLDAMYFRARSRYETGMYEESIADFGRVINADHVNNVFSYYFRGRSYQELEMYEEALEDFKISTELCLAREDEDEIRCDLDWQRRGEVNTALQRYDVAIDAYERALDINPDNYVALVGLLDVYQTTNSSNNPELLAYYGQLLNLREGEIFELDEDQIEFTMTSNDGSNQYHLPVTINEGETLRVRVQALARLNNESTGENTSSLRNAASQVRANDFTPLVVVTNSNDQPFAFAYSDDEKRVDLTVDEIPAGEYTVKISTTDATTNGRFQVIVTKN